MGEGVAAVCGEGVSQDRKRPGGEIVWRFPFSALSHLVSNTAMKEVLKVF